MNDRGSMNYSITMDDLQKELISAGINGEFIGRVVREGLEASKKEEPDHAVRLKYLQYTLELLDITHTRQKEEDGVEFYKGKFRELTDEQLEEEIRRTVRSLQKFPE